MNELSIDENKLFDSTLLSLMHNGQRKKQRENFILLTEPDTFDKRRVKK